MERSSTIAVTKRTAGRQAEIAEAAAGLFCQLGYHRVRMDDVAASVGITGGAIYRHFGNKQELLARTVSDAGASLAGALVPAGGLEPCLAALARLFASRRELGVLLTREVEQLAPDRRAEADQRAQLVLDAVARGVATERPELTADEALFLARAVLAAMGSLGYHTVPLAPGHGEAFLGALGARIVAADVRRDAGAGSGGSRASAERASRREALLAAAIRLFGERGYASVRMEDVGSATGISGPSIYHHFSSKADLLTAALTRGAEWLQLGMSQALTEAETAPGALRRIVASYASFAVAHPDLVRILLTEAINLPEPDRHHVRRLQHDYLAEWVNQLVAMRPDLSDSDARVLTHAVVGVVNDQVRSPAGELLDAVVPPLVAVGLAIVESPA